MFRLLLDRHKKILFLLHYTQTEISIELFS